MRIFNNKRIMAQSVAERRELILHGSSLKALLVLSFPTLLMAFVQSLIPLSDGLFLNRSGGVIVASAVGYSQPIINMITAVSQGLAVAATAIIGQLNGRGDMQKVRHVGSQIMVFGFALGLLLAPFSIVLAYFLSRTVNPALAPSVLTYLGLYSLVLPLLFIASIFNALKNATGQPEATFYRMLILLLSKLLFNTIFLAVLKMGVVGAVLASLASYIIIAIWMYYDLFVRVSETSLYIRGYRPDFGCIRQLLKLGIPSMISNALINFGFFLINAEIETYGPAVLNAQTISSNINSLAFTLPSAISTTVTTMVAMNIGIGQERSAKKVVWQALGISLAISVVLIAIFYPAAPLLVALFTDVPEISELAVSSLNIYTFSIIGFGAFMVAQGAFIGLGRTQITMLAGIARIWLFRYLFILAAKSFWNMGVEAVFWGNLFSNYLAAVIFVVILLKGKFKSAIQVEASAD